MLNAFIGSNPSTADVLHDRHAQPPGSPENADAAWFAIGLAAQADLVKDSVCGSVSMISSNQK
jgi:hypothetical protein